MKVYVQVFYTCLCYFNSKFGSTSYSAKAENHYPLPLTKVRGNTSYSITGIHCPWLKPRDSIAHIKSALAKYNVLLLFITGKVFVRFFDISNYTTMKKLLPLLLLLTVQAATAQVNLTLVNTTDSDLHGLILNKSITIDSIKRGAAITIQVDSINVLEGQAYLNLSMGYDKPIPCHRPNTNITHTKIATQGNYTVTINAVTDRWGNRSLVLSPHSNSMRCGNELPKNRNNR